MSSDLSDVYRWLNEISMKIDDLKTITKDLAENINDVRQEVVYTRQEVLNVLKALTALASAVAELRGYVEDQFNELRATAEKYREEFLAEHEKRHREAVALSTYQQDFLKSLDIAMLGIKARIEEISQTLKELEDKARKIDTRLFEYSLRLAAERVEIK
jgi:methyl-accepting chemotaxis protein